MSSIQSILFISKLFLQENWSTVIQLLRTVTKEDTISRMADPFYWVKMMRHITNFVGNRAVERRSSGVPNSQSTGENPSALKWALRIALTDFRFSYFSTHNAHSNWLQIFFNKCIMKAHRRSSSITNFFSLKVMKIFRTKLMSVVWLCCIFNFSLVYYIVFALIIDNCLWWVECN